MTAITYVKPIVFAAALGPAAWLAYRFHTGNLTADPVDYITRHTGTWALALLVISLAVTPLRRLTGWHAAIRLRRMLGLFAFFYAVLHLATWVVFYHFFAIAPMLEDVVLRPFITVGMVAFLILLVLAITSNRFAISRLGRRWQRLHRLVYVAAIAGVVHFWWLVKSDIAEPLRWAIALTVLLGLRVSWALRRRSVSGKQRHR